MTLPLVLDLPDENNKERALVVRLVGLEHDLRMPSFCCSKCGALVPTPMAERHAAFHGDVRALEAVSQALVVLQQPTRATERPLDPAGEGGPL